MRHHLATLAALTAGLATGMRAQGPAPIDPVPLAAWPEDFATSAFAAVRDAQGAVIPRRVLAGGSADFDRDGNDDAWLLTDAGGGMSQLHALLANTADLGRFHPWADWAPAARPDAAAWRSIEASDVVLAVDPAGDRLDHRFYLPNLTAPDPRLSGTWTAIGGWLVGRGCFEIETGDFDADGHDDLALLRDLGNGSTELKLIEVGTLGGPPMPVRELTLALPVPLQRLRVLDADGDGRMDASVVVPGFGVAVFGQGKAAITLRGFVPAAGTVRELCAGDVDRDGIDDLGIALDAGVLLLPTASPVMLLANPPGVGPLAGAAIADLDHDGWHDVVAVPASGDGVVVHRREAAGFAAPRWHAPASAPTGAGIDGLAAFAFDADADGDTELAVQVRDGSFATLRCAARTLAPLRATIVHEGRHSESYIRERLDCALPPQWQQAGYENLEVGIYMRHPQDPARPWVLWARDVLPKADGVTNALSVRLFYLVDRARLPLLTNPFLYPGGYAVHGDTLLTLHAKRGSQRGESLLVFHEGRGDENKSTLGVQWKVLAAPPVPRADAQLLPFN